MNNREKLVKILRENEGIIYLEQLADRILESLAKCEECDGDGCFGSKSGGYTNCDHCSGTGIIVKEVK